MDYFMGIFKAIVPRKKKDIIAVSLLVIPLTYVGAKIAFEAPPTVTIYSETQYPKEAVRGDFFFLAFDISFGQSCSVKARRVITGSDGIEYLASEDSKEVIANERMKYIVRVPVIKAIPFGPASVRSDFEYGCDWWSRHIRPITTEGRSRNVNIVPQLSAEISPTSASACELPKEPGMVAVKAHYRRAVGMRSEAQARASLAVEK